jgi:O-antigen ligase
MDMGVSKGKSNQLPSKLFMVNKNAVYTMPVAVLIVVLFPFIIANDLTILWFVFITGFLFLGSTKILVTSDFVTIVMIMLLGLGIMAYSYDKEPLITVQTMPFEQGIVTRDMFLTSIVCFFVFIVGYLYSFVVKRPLRTLPHIFLYAWILVTIYFRVAHGAFFLGNSLMLGSMIIVLLPYMYLVFIGKPKTRIIFSLIILWYLMLILARTAFAAAVIFFLTYYLYPYLIVSKRRYKLFFLSFVMTLFILISFYLLASRYSSDPFLISVYDSINDFSKKYFTKKLASGRGEIWFELVSYIKDKSLFGYGINQNSGFIQSSGVTLHSRALDAHSNYFELLLRGGVLLLSYFLILFYKIWGSFYSINNNKMSRIAASGLLAFIFLGGGIPIGLTGNIVLNTLFWFYWGVASGNTWIKNHQMITYNTLPT